MASIRSNDVEFGQGPNFNHLKDEQTYTSQGKVKEFFIWVLIASLGTLLALACLVLIILIFTLFLSVVWKIPQDLNPPSKSLYELTSHGTTSIQDVCSITTYPNVCSSTLEGLKDLSWPSYIKVTLKASLLDIEDAHTRWKASLDAMPTKNGIQYSNIQQCVEDYESAQSTIKDSLFIVQDSNIKVPLAQLDDLNQYISATSTFHSDCLDAMQDYGLIGDDDIPFASKFNGKHLTELLSNALALLAE